MSHKLSSRPGKEFAVDLEFTHDGFQPLLAGGSGHIAKCSFAIFLDEPQPGNAIVYVELVTCGTRQVGLRFHDHEPALARSVCDFTITSTQIRSRRIRISIA